MVESKAIALLEQALSEIRYLRALKYDSQGYPLWHSKILTISEVMLGVDSKECKKFLHHDPREHILSAVLKDYHFLEDYLENLRSDEKP